MSTSKPTLLQTASYTSQTEAALATVTVTTSRSGRSTFKSTAGPWSPSSSSLSAKNSCMISLSAITRTAHTFSKYCSKPRLLASSCSSLNLHKYTNVYTCRSIPKHDYTRSICLIQMSYWNGHFPGSFGKLKPMNSFFKAIWRAANSL